MQKKSNLTSLHCIFFIYQSFAFNSDNKLTDSEKKVIANFMFRWTGQNKEQLNQIINETLIWSNNNIKTPHDQIGVMFTMLDFLKQQSNFNLAKREYFLMDVRNIARSDGDFSDQQRKWHDMMAKYLGVEIRISPQSFAQIETSLKNVKKKKIGFRRDKG